MGTIRHMRADGSEHSEPGDAMPPFDRLREMVGGGIDFAWVLHQGRKTCMVVNELGATDWKPGYPLPINTKATDIYHNAGRSRGKDWVGPPYIHGDVVLLEGIEVD